ncbi:type VII secretion integral membrane protein EccD [Mycobacterium asiaticum]|uniref:Type VII secretion integral membrane protein EccD n=1 Tax=Mycobacterium asiaticum TaxID=1790 RepID=A0A1A3N466_MYCAS|nr:type VII secretion integral membrane protein EccD [Mycobacterium asiaticum]OBK15162.1 type VII secretion integral membrane protein EccD [Mycobacterium asiaticum]
MSSAIAAETRRVAVHAGETDIDLTIPAGVPVAVLIPAIVDLLGGADDLMPARYRIAPVGGRPLLNSTTLAQNGIEDGAVLVLTRDAPVPPSPRCADEAEGVAASLRDPTPTRGTTRLSGALGAILLTAVGTLMLARNTCIARGSAYTVAILVTAAAVALISAGVAQRAYREPFAAMTLSVVAAMFGAVAGLLAVPGPPGAPHVLLAAMAAATTAVLAIRTTDCGSEVLTTLVGCAIVEGIAALAAVLTTAPTQVVGAVTVVVCLVLIEMAPRICMLVTGLVPGLPNPAVLACAAARAERWLASLRGALAVATGAGAAVAALASPRAIVLAAVTAGVLLMHARSGHRPTAVFTGTGIATAGGVLAITAVRLPQHEPWIAALTTVLAAGAIYLGFVAPARSLSPMARRVVDALGCVVLAATVPLACWTCGAFGAVRNLNLLRT